MIKYKSYIGKVTLIATLLFSVTAVAPMNTDEAHAVTKNIEYKDVKKSHWAYESIAQVGEKDIMIGYNGNFNPNGAVTRAEFAKVLALAIDGNQQTQHQFTDVKPDFWGTTFINEGIALGVIDPSEFKNNQFEPNKKMTRAEIAKWMSKGLVAINDEYDYVLEELASASKSVFPIVDVNEVKTVDLPFVGLMMGTELMVGDSNNKFKPNATVTRAEVATIILRYLEKMNKEPQTFSKLNQYRVFTVVEVE